MASRVSPAVPASLWTRKDLLGLDELSPQEILHVLEAAESFREVSTRSIKKVPALRGKVVALLFFESSTRTRLSFELAERRLSADVLGFQAHFGEALTAPKTVWAILDRFAGETDAEQTRFLGIGLRSVVETVACLHVVYRRRYLSDAG